MLRSAIVTPDTPPVDHHIGLFLGMAAGGILGGFLGNRFGGAEDTSVGAALGACFLGTMVETIPTISPGPPPPPQWGMRIPLGRPGRHP